MLSDKVTLIKAKALKFTGQNDEILTSQDQHALIPIVTIIVYDFFTNFRNTL